MGTRLPKTVKKDQKGKTQRITRECVEGHKIVEMKIEVMDKKKEKSKEQRIDKNKRA